MSVFLLVSTQWRVSFGSIIGLDYTAVKGTLNAARISFKRMLGGLQIIEQRIIELSNRKSDA